MNTRPPVRAGLIGMGIGKFYATALRCLPLYYPELPPVNLVAVATASRASGEQALRQFSFQLYTTDYRELLASDDLEMVVIASPNYLHHDMLLQALQTKLAVYVDKPLANNLAEARDITRAARAAGRDAQMIFEVRYCPALQLARRLLKNGRLGRVYAFRSAYFRSSYVDPAKPLRWKGSLAQSGAGVLNDYAPHSIDLILWLVGRPERVAAQLRTFIAERPPSAGSPDRVPIETDDHMIAQLALPEGVIGTIEAGRLIAGCVNDLTLEIYGSEGSLRWSLAEPNSLWFADRKRPADEVGWLKIPTNENFPDSALPGGDLPLGMLRLHIAGLADFLRRTVDQRPYDPNLAQGWRVQAVIEAAAQSARSGEWMTVAND